MFQFRNLVIENMLLQKFPHTILPRRDIFERFFSYNIRIFLIGQDSLRREPNFWHEAYAYIQDIQNGRKRSREASLASFHRKISSSRQSRESRRSVIRISSVFASFSRGINGVCI